MLLAGYPLAFHITMGQWPRTEVKNQRTGVPRGRKTFLQLQLQLISTHSHPFPKLPYGPVHSEPPGPSARGRVAQTAMACDGWFRLKGVGSQDLAGLQESLHLPTNQSLGRKLQTI